MSLAASPHELDLLLTLEQVDGGDNLRAALTCRKRGLLCADTAPFPFPLQRLEAEYLRTLRDYVERPVAGEMLVALGQELALLLPAEVRSALQAELLRAATPEARMRLRLRANHAAVAALPWEFLYLDPAEFGTAWGGFPALGPSVSIIRQVDAGRKGTGYPPLGEEPVRALLVWANPASANHPALSEQGEELRSTRTALRPHAGLRVEVKELPHATKQSLAKEIRDFRPHLLHFTGHGDRRAGGSVLILDGGDTGAEAALSGAELADWLRNCPIRLMVLAACYSACGAGSVAEALAMAGVPAVVGMQLPQRPASAALFVRSFYGALLEPCSVEDALRQARSAVRGQGPDWGAPALLLSVAGSNLFPPHQPPPFLVRFARNPGFVGHEKLLTRLHGQLSEPPHAYVELSGLGGSGKSQLAVEYAHRHRDDYPGGIYWIDARDHQHLTQSYLELADLFEIPELGSADGRALRVVAHLQSLPDRALLILDNVTPESRDLRRPTTGRCSIVATTRWKGNLPDFQPCPIPPLDEEAAIALLQASGPPAVGEERAALQRIVRRLDYLPLALALVSHRTRRLRLSFVEALEQLQSSGQSLEWLDRARKQFISSTGHDGNIYRAIELSYLPLEQSARCVLSAAACFGGRGMASRLLHESCDTLDDVDFREALADLEDLTLLTREPEERVTVHELVREFSWLTLEEADRGPVARKVAAVLTRSLRTANEELEWRPVRAEIPHCYAAADRCATTGELAARQALLRELGCYHFHQRDLMPALGHLRESLDLAELLYGRRQIETARLLMWHGFVESTLKRHGSARQSLAEALSIAEEVLPAGDGEIAEFHNGLGYVLKYAGELGLAYSQYQRALEIAETAYGHSHALTAKCLNNLGGVLQSRGVLQAAQEHYREALKIDSELFPPGNYRLAIRMNNLGAVLTMAGMPKEAEELHRRALGIFAEAFDGWHLHAGMSRCFLAAALLARGDRPQARDEYRLALLILERARGTDADICHEIREKLRLVEAEGTDADY